MNISVKSCSSLKGSIQLPGSKSYTIRAFMIAHCAKQATIINPSNSNDAKVSMRVIEQLGSKILKIKRNAFRISPSVKKIKISSINVKESGTVLRFLLPLASLTHNNLTITGEGTLKGRPNAHLIATLKAMGKKLEGSGPQASIPIKIYDGKLRGGTISIDGSLSSQFISALLITCVQLKENTKIVLKGKELVSSDYIAMTIQVLKVCGIRIKKLSVREIFIKGNQKFKPLSNFCIPSDSGLAAFSMAAACLIKSDIFLKGFLRPDFVQADSAIFGFLKKMGARIIIKKQGIFIKGPFMLKGGKFSLKSCPDLVPIMAVLALFAKTPTRLTGIAHARAKESDRLSDLRHELLKVGADIRETKGTLVIHPKDFYKPNVFLDPHHDHRLAMAFCVLGLKVPVTIKDIECTHKSYPDFVRDFKMLGARLVSV